MKSNKETVLDLETRERLRKYGCPLDWEALEFDAHKQEKDTSIIVGYDASYFQCRAIPYRPDGGVYYVLQMHITSKAANRYVMDYCLTTEWDEGICLLTSSSFRHEVYYSIPLADLQFRADEVLNERCGPRAGRIGSRRFLNGMLLGFGVNPIPKGRRAALVRVWLWDQFDNQFFGDVPATVDRSYISTKVPSRGTGLWEPDEEEELDISERSRIAYLKATAMGKGENAVAATLSD
ncbi:MAG TPA: hypothetical protein VGR48_15410 [Terriglobales bacterium]|nr:hypothetical protein [Terriglobales bacterium]